jgi:hypothetical protein
MHQRVATSSIHRRLCVLPVPTSPVEASPAPLPIYPFPWSLLASWVSRSRSSPGSPSDSPRITQLVYGIPLCTLELPSTLLCPRVDVSTLIGTVLNGHNATNITQAKGKILEREMAHPSLCVVCMFISAIFSPLFFVPFFASLSHTSLPQDVRKFSDLNTDSGHGANTPSAGLGWTNGLLFWVASKYGDFLAARTCPLLLICRECSCDYATRGFVALRLRRRVLVQQ